MYWYKLKVEIVGQFMSLITITKKRLKTTKS